MRKLRWSLAVATGALTVLVLTTTSAARRSAKSPGPILSVSPSAVTFANTLVGDFNYRIVTISNTGDVDDYIVAALADPNPPFFPTFAGTCNTSIGPSGANYYIPAGTSCTFQWGFHPAVRGRQSGTGTLVFLSGGTLPLSFAGKAPH